jgi:hypothetical protein
MDYTPLISDAPDVGHSQNCCYLERQMNNELEPTYIDALRAELESETNWANELAAANARIVLLEMMLDTHAPGWEKAQLFSTKPMMTEDEAKEIFGGSEC